MMNLLEMFGTLRFGKKISFVVLALTSVVALIVLFVWANRPEYQVLFTNLSEQDASKIIERLQSENIDYKVGASGTVRIPNNLVYETMLKLAVEGLTKSSGVGFDIFDKSGFGISEFVQKVNYNRALQGELARTISGFTEVETASIHLGVPEKRFFADSSESARASVVLKLKGVVNLKPRQIQGIVNLVASSVSGLSAENVTVIDSSGKLLTKVKNDDAGINLTSSQLEYQRAIESSYEMRIQDMLSPVVGIGKVIARVSVEIDFTQAQKTLESYDPDSVVLRSEQTHLEKSIGAASNGGAVPGVMSSVSERGRRERTAEQPSIRNETKDETYNYEINRTVSTIVEPTGRVKRLSVAVLVDGAHIVSRADDGALTSKYVVRSEEELAKFTDLIENAIGINDGRGDTVEVVNIPFETELPPEVVEEPSILEKILGDGVAQVIIRYATILIMSLLILFFILRPLIKGILMFEPLPDGQAPSAEAEVKLDSIASAKKNLKEMVTQNPQAAANIIKVWLKGKGPDGE